MTRNDWRLVAIVGLALAEGLLLSRSLPGDIFRWDNGQLIPGTERDTPWPFVELDRRRLDYANLREADLTGASFSESSLRNADLSRTKLADVDFESSDLSGADLRGAQGFEPDETTVLENLIWPDAIVTQLQIDRGDAVAIRVGPEINVTDGFAIEGGGMLRLHADYVYIGEIGLPKLIADADVTPELGGVLRLSLSTIRETPWHLEELFSNSFLTHDDGTWLIDLFDWPGPLEPGNRFSAVELPVGIAWDTGELYSTGVIKVNAIGNFGDFDANGELDSLDVDLLTGAIRAGWDLAADVNLDRTLDEQDLRMWVHEVKGTYFGDGNLDGEFNSGDLVAVFQAGEYEDDEPMNSGWGTGDWNGDGEFDTSDLVLAFQDGGYEQPPGTVGRAVPEPASSAMLLSALMGIATRRWRHAVVGKRRCRGEGRRGRRRRSLHHEACEEKVCLSFSAVAFVSHDVDARSSGNLWSSIALHAADMDRDGDADIILASGARSSIAWYENTDAVGTFGPPKVVTNGIQSPTWVTAGDLDGDDDMDVLSASFYDDTIAWYANVDGIGEFGPKQIISSEADGGQSVFSADIDGDGVLDVLSASEEDNTIAWHRNSDGAGTFGPPQVVTNKALGPESVYAADLDGDGDVDVLSASEDDNIIAWYENINGRGAFGPQRVITNRIAGAETVQAADLDGDGDMDVLSASWIDDKVAWYENTDGSGAFGPQQLIAARGKANGALTVCATDIDGDGDLDVVSASFYDGKIAWYENIDGAGAFGSQQVIGTAEGAQSALAADIDGDGDIDVVSASSGNDGLAHWYEQRLIGDSNNDGVFDSADLVQVFQAGKYEDDVRRNATFDEGDWNQDGDFTSDDLVLAFQTGHYVPAATPVENQVAAAIDAIFAVLENDEPRKPQVFVQ